MSELLVPLLTTTPWLLLWLVAGVLAAARWSRHPTVSALVVTASIIHVLTTVAGRVLPLVMVRQGHSVESMGVYYSAVSVFGLVGSACLVGAVFAGRQDGGSTGVPPR
jgi:hypothetical protein